MNRLRVSKYSVWMLYVGGVLLFVSLFFPFWRIELDAPQYPEGLALLIWADGLKGDVDVINGLNHYIGMKELHSEDFFEFTILPYIMMAFGALYILVAILRKKIPVYILFVLFVVFGITALVDFWLWEYNYGHDLNPNAAIKVPGMSYQPPLIGFKQLLNFGAYAMPDVGGWLLVFSGFLLAVVVVKEWKQK